MLLYLEFVDSAAVTRRELLWLSAIVRSPDPAYDVPRMGPLYFVARSYADRDASQFASRAEATSPDGDDEAGSRTDLGPGRESAPRDWHLPRTYARFERFGNRIEVDAEDGTRVVFSWTPRNLTLPSPTSIASMQNSAGRVVCFQSEGHARAQLATYRLESFASDHPDWQSFASGLVLPGVASYLKSFDTSVRSPFAVPRRLDSIAPTPSLVRVARV
jgi:hypothetical protein